MKLLPLFIFWCLWFINVSTRNVFVPLLPLIEDNFALSHAQAGGLYASLSIGYGISLFLTGWFASVWGYKKTVIMGFIGIALIHNIPLLVIVLIVQAVFSVGFFPIAFSTLSKLTSLQERSMVTGIILAFAIIFGAGLTPFLLGAIADSYNFKLGILSVGIVTTLATFSVGLLKETVNESVPLILPSKAAEVSESQ